MKSRPVLLASTLLLSACAGVQQSAVDPAGQQSGRIAGLFWFFLILLTVIFAAVIVMTAVALTRRRRGAEQEAIEQTHSAPQETEQKLTRNVRTASIATTLILLGLVVMSVSTGKAISDRNPHKNPLTVEVTGNQWWWYVRYPNDIADLTITTANEIHIPVGRPVMIRGTSNDVIHSFWVPNLHGKADLIPSRVRTEWIEADRPGRFRGQCAEFCGLQHAHMALWVVAETQQQFDAWMKRQLQPAIEPANEDTKRGKEVFLTHACVMCHAIAGTTAAGQTGPDLTHLASRSTIAAGTLPNTKGNLAGWIVDPQRIKPGNHMAVVQVAPQDLQPLIDYLGSLQ